MLSVVGPFRRAIFQVGDGNITYRNVVIPVWDRYANSPGVDLGIGNNMPVEAWVRLMDQDANNTSIKCLRSDQAAITIQAQTSFIGTSGNAEHSEAIMNIYLELLFSGEIEIEEPFRLKRLEKISERNLDYQDDSNRIFMTAVTLTGTVEQ